MEDYEIMVSESQERMLAVLDPESRRGDAVGLRALADGRGGDRRGDRDRAAPRRSRRPGGGRGPGFGPGRRVPALRPRAREAGRLDVRQPRPLAAGAEPDRILGGLLSSPSVASKRWAFEQYDAIVGSRTVRLPESADAAVLRIAESGRAIAVAIDGNGRRVACDPYLGTIEAVLECAQNLACVGAEPLGLTNCLNFGNPEKPHVAWQLERSVQGLADACGALGVPVVGGNVSLYNETEEGPIYPTPVVGMVGELPDPERAAGNGAAPGGRDRARRALCALAGRVGAGEAAG